jgi:type VI secretion system protein VasG
LLPEIAGHVLERMASGTAITRIIAGADEGGGFSYVIE